MDRRTGKQMKTKRTKSVSYELEKLFELFLDAKIAEGRAPSTIRRYKDCFHYLCEYLDEKEIAHDIRQITTEVMRSYISWMLHEKVKFEGHKYKSEESKTVGLSAVTVNTRLRKLRPFFTFIVEEDYYDTNPMKSIKAVEEEEDEIIVLTVDELRRLLAAPDIRTYAGFRDHTLMHLLLDTFLRINEALHLTWNDIDLDAKMLNVRAAITKSRKSRMVPLSQKTVTLLRELQQETKEFENEYIFLANYGERLEANHFRNRLREYAKETGITKRVHPHLFRHTGATMFLERGGDVRHLQLLMGHSDLRMILRYTHLSKESLKQQHHQYSPIHQLEEKLERSRKIKR